MAASWVPKETEARAIPLWHSGELGSIYKVRDRTKYRPKMSERSTQQA